MEAVRNFVLSYLLAATAVCPAVAQTTLICSGLHGSGIDWNDGKIRRYEDGYSGAELVVVMNKASAVVTWKGFSRIRDEATIVNSNDRKGWVSFFAANVGVSRLYTLFKTSTGRYVLAMTEHQRLLFDDLPQSRTFFAKCK